MKKILIIAMVIIFPLLRALIMNEFLFYLIFHALGFEYPSSFFLSFHLPEHFTAQITVPLIWLAFYLPFFVIFPKGKRLNTLQIFTRVLSFTASMGFIEFLGETTHGKTFTGQPMWWIFFSWIFIVIAIPVFIVETVLVAWKIDGFKDIGFLKSLCVSVLSFLIFPFLLVFGVQMVFGGR